MQWYRPVITPLQIFLHLIVNDILYNLGPTARIRNLLPGSKAELKVLTLIRVALEENLQLLFKMILYPDALS